MTALCIWQVAACQFRAFTSEAIVASAANPVEHIFCAAENMSLLKRKLVFVLEELRTQRSQKFPTAIHVE
jgi:hypothetical protein